MVGGRTASLMKIACIMLAVCTLTAAVPFPASGGAGEVIYASFQEGPRTLGSGELINSLVAAAGDEVVEKHLRVLQGLGTRYSPRTDKCIQAADYVQSVFEENGLKAVLDDFPYSTVTLRNVIGEATGKTAPGDIIVICAHYDSITAEGWTDAPGADDNGSGTAAVLAAAEILSDYEFNSTIRFAAFCGEEQGLLGSDYYAQECKALGENIAAVINMDMIGYNPGPVDNFINLYTGVTPAVDPTPLVNEAFATLAEHPEIALQILDGGPDSASDHQSFADIAPSIMFLETEFSPYYHSTEDTVDKMNLTYCANVTQLTIAMAAGLAGIIPGDLQPPVLSPGFPADGGYARPEIPISIEAADPGGFNMSALSMRVNGIPVAPSLDALSMGYNISYVPVVPFADGQVVNVSVHAEDIAGHGSNRTWSYTVDATPPLPPTKLTLKASRVELMKYGLVLDIGAPYDTRHATSPSVMFRDGEYKMWYGATNGTQYVICYANSTDGLAWDKQGVTLGYGQPGDPDEYNANHPSVLYDGEYKMWYAGYGADATWRILYANSSDGIHWLKGGVAVGNGSAGGLDSAGATYPAVVRTDEYEMWYMATDGFTNRYMYANSSDGLAWVKHPAEITPSGYGTVYNGGTPRGLGVSYFNGTYRMYYGRYDGSRTLTICANSTDGLHWRDVGLAIDVRDGYTYDYLQADHCSVLFSGSETRAYYSGYSNARTWRILMANISLADTARDLTLSWTPSASGDVALYEVFRESRPSAFGLPLVPLSPEGHVPPFDQSAWAFETATVANRTVFEPQSSQVPQGFHLPDDNIIDLSLYLRLTDGSWMKMEDGYDSGFDPESGYVDIYTPLLSNGTALHAWYNYTASRALRTSGSSAVDVRAGVGDTKCYYYVVRAVDRAGNRAMCGEMQGKMGAQLTGGWNLVCSPLLGEPVPVEAMLEGLDWAQARTWEPERWPHEWTSNRPGSDSNTLEAVDAASGVWVLLSSDGAMSTTGKVSNITINLTAGWNLVSFPYHELMTVDEALAGQPWDRAELMDPWSPGLIREAVGTDILFPGQGMWVHVTSDSVWLAVNHPEIVLNP